MRGPVQSVEVSYFVHATEDPVKLSTAVSAMFSVSTPPDEEKMEGHHGNPITRIKYHITGDAAAVVLTRVSKKLDAATKQELARSLGDLLDRHSDLYLRFDKQRLVEGSLTGGIADAVRVKVKLRGYLARGDIIDFYSQILAAGGP